MEFSLWCVPQQIKYSDLPGGVLSAARQLAGNKATPAIELVGYDHELEAAMKNVFGGAFICQVGINSGTGTLSV